MYLNEIKEDDQRMADAWKQDAKGVLVFVSPKLLISVFVSMTSPKTGLFSTIVGAFIIEFYKKLEPGSASNTADQPSLPSASMIWVNAMWLVSLVLSLTSALVATLLQQWARRYIETPSVPNLNEPSDRARVREFLFLGTKKYKMPLAVEIAPILLHLSVCLFLGGLVIIFHTVNTKVAIAVDVAVGIFGLPYIVITVIPLLDIRCPYRTPISFILWYPLHAFLSIVARGLYWFLEQVDGCLDSSPTWRCSILDGLRIFDWKIALNKAARKRWQYVMGGFEEAIIESAKDPLEHGDRKIITWLFKQLVLYDKIKLQKLAADIPRNRIRDLIPFIESEKVVLQEPLLVLFRSCAAADTRAAEPDEDVRKRSLLVCLDIIHHIAKSPDIPDLNFMRANFANIVLMRPLWTDSDTNICVTSRSICALLAKKVVRQVHWARDPQTAWLQAVVGEEFDRNQIYSLRSEISTLDRMILKFFLYGVLLNQDGDLPTESSKCFKETLAILLDVQTQADDDFDMVAYKERLEGEVRWIQQDNTRGNVVVDKLRSIFLFPLPV
jgi:Family of unknown function (DUF6535)